MLQFMYHVFASIQVVLVLQLIAWLDKNWTGLNKETVLEPVIRDR